MTKKISNLRDKIYDELLRSKSATLLQQTGEGYPELHYGSTIGPNGIVHHLSSMELLLIIASIVIGKYFEGFFYQLGSDSANQLKEFLKKIRKKSAVDELDLEKIEEIVLSTLSNLKIAKEKLIHNDKEGLNYVQNELCEHGMPKNKAKILSEKIVKIIKDYFEE